ncbi:MAG: hypothetical protein FWH21_03875 [Kiritimatiellaeota bacterium]|nr:hypothetical protein [Kiritimatiellota bacterium]
MKRLTTLAAIAALALTTANAATIITVGNGGDHATLQAAIEIADDKDEIVAAPGTYEFIVVGNKDILIRSEGGPSVTFIDGGGTNRCATLGELPNENLTVLSGFTLTNGVADFGGGALRGTLTNCVLTANAATNLGGGAYYSILNACTLIANCSTNQGGGACYGTLNNCTIIENRSMNSHGGGTYDATLNNCVLTGNISGPFSSGGGAFEGTLVNCTLTGNMAGVHGGGVYNAALTNCVLTGNVAQLGGGASGSTLYNCTLTRNKVTNTGGGVYNCSTLANCIVWGNVWFNPTTEMSNNYGGSCSFTYSCSSPEPAGTGNTGLDPMFVNVPDNLRLSPGSPCIDSGDNSAVVGILFDLDGNARILNGGVNGLTVDMGAYEYDGHVIPPVATPVITRFTLDGGNITLLATNAAPNTWYTVIGASSLAAGFLPLDPLPLVPPVVPQYSTEEGGLDFTFGKPIGDIYFFRVAPAQTNQ